MVVERIRALQVWGFHEHGPPSIKSDRVVIEEPLEIRLDGEALAVLMRTPGHDLELAAGLLLSEQLIARADQLLSITHCNDPAAEHPENVVEVRATGLERDASRARRTLLTSSSCGLCGKRTIESIQVASPPFERTARIDPALIRALPDRLRAAQAVFAETGGLHGAALMNEAGEPWVVREDIGRHNAVDKCIGHFILRGQLPPEGSILVVSGRVSFEIVQKALVARIPAIAAISAPSSLAVELAQASKMALYGFVRGGSFNQYAGET